MTGLWKCSQEGKRGRGSSIKKEEVEKEIEILKFFHDFYRFEQNHVLSDFTMRMALIVPLGITIGFASLNYGHPYLASLAFFGAFFELFRYNWALKKERNKILKKTDVIRRGILERYNLLGININKILGEYDKHLDHFSQNTAKS